VACKSNQEGTGPYAWAAAYVYYYPYKLAGCHMACQNRQNRVGRKKHELALGAKLTILPHPFILKSALTMPPIRVPSISLLLLRSTAALSSKRIIRPSGLRTGFLDRTMTARRTSPRRTLTAVTDACVVAETGRARLTTQTISSPTVPQPLLTLFFKTLTHSTISAPELSMHWKIVSSLSQRKKKHIR
jgi:hypothetical protein